MKHGFRLFSGIVLAALFALPVTASTATASSEQEPVLRFYLVRHGETLSNIKAMTIGGGGNAELTAKGRYDASSLGLGLAEVPFIAAYSSTLGRAFQTASLVLRGRDLPVQQLDALKDISWGEAEGGRIDDLTAKYGHSGNDFAFYFGRWDDAHFVSPVKAENVAAFSRRFEGALRDIALQYRGQSGNILIAAHSSMAFWLQKYRRDQPLSGLSNTSVSLLEWRDNHFTLVDFNNTDYLKRGYEKDKALAPLEIKVVINPLTHLSEIGVMEGTTDSDFTPKGEQVNQKIAARLSQTRLIAAYSSELGRAVKTAARVLQPHHLSLTKESQLNELFLGSWEAEKVDTIKTHAAAAALFAPGQVINFVPEIRAERGDIAAARLDDFLSAVARRYEFASGSLVIFTHPLVLDAFLSRRIDGYSPIPRQGAQIVTLTYKNEVFGIKQVELL